MNQIEVKEVLAATGLNITPNCISCSPDGSTLAFSAGSSVVFSLISVPNSSFSINVCPSEACHSAPGQDAISSPRSNCVCFASSTSLLSGTSDGRVCLLQSDNPQLSTWKCASEARLPKVGQVLCVSACPTCGNFAVSINSSACAMFWNSFKDFSTAFSTIPSSSGSLFEACSCTELPTINSHIIALGGVDKRVKLFLINKENNIEKITEIGTLIGHTDWIRTLAFSSQTNDPIPTVLLASGSQDTRVRIWKISISNSKQVNISLESVLSGHDDWVTSISWIGFSRIITASMDRTISLWLPDPSTGVWISSVRLWGVPGTVLGGSVYGFRSLTITPNGSTVFAHGFTGAVHCWDFNPYLSDTSLSSDNPPTSSPRILIPSGHGNGGGCGFGRSVSCVSWSKNPNFPLYLLSGGEDRTIRIFTQYKKLNNTPAQWQEIARPMIHGHSIRGACMIGKRNSFAVIAEERAVRVLDAPSTFIESLFLSNKQEISAEIKTAITKLPMGAALPPLSLSNRPIFSLEEASQTCKLKAQEEIGVDVEEGDEEAGTGPSDDSPSAPAVLSNPPLEEHLTHNTLWPEMSKLFSHRIDCTCISSSLTSASELFVSGCSSFKQGDATVCVWKPGSVQPIAVLSSHRAAITALSISSDGTLIASSGLDLSLVLWSPPPSSSPCDTNWKLGTKIEHAFNKPPNGCSWSINNNHNHNLLCVTGGEETGGALLFYSPTPKDLIPCGIIPTQTRTTTSSWADSSILAIGEENGSISIWSVSSPTLESKVKFMKLISFPQNLCHINAVRCLDWHREESLLLLASGGDDGFVKIASIKIPNQ